MRFKMFRNLTTMIMCAAVTVVSCLPVNAAEQALCSHPRTIPYDHGYGDYVTESGTCGDCACASCPAEITYIEHYMGFKCADCDYVQIDTVLEYVSHTCGCTTCECVCGYN